MSLKSFLGYNMMTYASVADRYGRQASQKMVNMDVITRS